MSFPSGPLVADLFAAATFSVLVTKGVRHRNRPGATSAALLWVALAIVATVLVAGRAEFLSVSTVMFAVVIGWIVTVPLWAGFALEYTGRGPTLGRRAVTLAVLYVVVAAVTTANTGRADGLFGQFVRIGVSLLQTGLFGTGMFGVFLIVRSTVAAEDHSLGRAVLVSLGGLGVSLLLVSLSSAGSGTPEALPVSISAFLVVIAAGFGGAVYGYGLFHDTPGTDLLARRSVLDEMSEAVVVLDREQRLVDANDAAESNLRVTMARDAGRPVSAVLGRTPDEMVSETTMLPTAEGRRRFDVRRSPLTDRAGDTVGTSYVLQDVTDQRTREQRLAVLNRVLRHNIRNDLDAIRGFAEALSTASTEDPERVAERIRGTAAGLADIGETVDRADSVFTRDSLDAEVVDLVALARSVVDDIDATNDCQVSVSPAEDGAVLRTDPGVLRTALHEVVENAVEHGDGDLSTVTLAVTSTTDGARVVVSDDGPGIPEREKAILLDGEESPLRHGTGVGLWFVSWAVARLGGELSFPDQDGDGSEVRITVPDRGEHPTEGTP